MTRPSGPRGEHRDSGHACQERTKEGGACPVSARRSCDPDGAWRCAHHSIQPEIREALRLARLKGSFKAVERLHQGPVVVSGERYLTAESLDEVFDEAINTLRTELRTRKSSKPQVATAIAAMADAKVKIRQLAWMANAQRRLNSAREGIS